MENKNNNIDEISREEDAVVDDLSFFMPGKAEEVEEIERIVSRRFKDNEGNVVPFRFKPIQTTRIDELEKQHTIPVYSGSRRRKTGEKLDNARFMAHIAVETTIYPNFKSEKLRNAYGEQDPIEVAKKMLHVGGEYAEWLHITNEINGFEDSPEDLEEAAKN